jgi:integrase
MSDFPEYDNSKIVTLSPDDIIVKGEPRKSTKRGQMFWTVRELNGKGPGGNSHYIFRYESKGKRVVKWFSSKLAAQKKAKELNAELTANGLDCQLDLATRLQAYRATAILEPYGVSLVEAAEFFVAARKREENPVMVSTIIEAVRNEYRLRLANKEVRKTTVASLFKSLNGLSEAFGNANVKTIDGAEIKDYIARKKEWAPKTKVGKFVDFSTAFKRAVQLRLIERNPLEGIDNFRSHDKAPIEIIPVDKVKDLISKAPERCRAALVLKFFTGMRTSEVCKLDWSAINLERRSLLVSKEVSKTRSVRRLQLTGLLDGVVAWLKPYAKEGGKIYDHTESTFNKDIAEAEQAVGYEISDNAARHTFCSRHYVAGKNDTATTQITGHSIKMLVGNYVHDVSEADAKAFFALRPDEFKPLF